MAGNGRRDLSQQFDQPTGTQHIDGSFQVVGVDRQGHFLQVLLVPDVLEVQLGVALQRLDHVEAIDLVKLLLTDACPCVHHQPLALGGGGGFFLRSQHALGLLGGFHGHVNHVDQHCRLGSVSLRADQVVALPNLVFYGALGLTRSNDELAMVTYGVSMAICILIISLTVMCGYVGQKYLNTY